MPMKPKVPCKEPGCPNLCDIGQRYCEEHRKLHPSEFRNFKNFKHRDGLESASERGYGSKWQKARDAYLHKHPLCVECQKEGKYVKATVVDHIVPHRGDWKLFWDSSNWQSLCKFRHDKKTLSEDVLRPKREKTEQKKTHVYDYPWRRNPDGGDNK